MYYMRTKHTEARTAGSSSAAEEVRRGERETLISTEILGTARGVGFRNPHVTGLGGTSQASARRERIYPPLPGVLGAVKRYRIGPSSLPQRGTAVEGKHRD
ncbi:hypothetical protein CIHG_02065 [Coccidioides immitis H538.4]|uniref:Uncharacterized protein n=2 Tax=Coccidioides immitis TaxID=5501 RepID=A0A0J8RK17_COCIT|nr:hypothetical protein CIRG_00242 [Coccidioides immitis RMSCC 2394]KMU84279.1 hypothetical protein CIHG_02065 [Coccidioides immitis H538.4]